MCRDIMDILCVSLFTNVPGDFCVCFQGGKNTYVCFQHSNWLDLGKVFTGADFFETLNYKTLCL